jgi:hypothetical protein
MFLCLIERSLVERVAHQKNQKEPNRIIAAFKWYGPLANIQPCIFNVVVDVFEAIQPLAGITLFRRLLAFC